MHYGIIITNITISIVINIEVKFISESHNFLWKSNYLAKYEIFTNTFTNLMLKQRRNF